MSTGFSAAERGQVRLGDAVAIFAQRPVGLCATAGVRLAGASLVIGVDSVPRRLELARRMGMKVAIRPWCDGEQRGVVDRPPDGLRPADRTWGSPWVR